MEFFKAGEAIEGLKLDTTAKKIIPSNPSKHPKFGTHIKYTCTRDCRSIITKELEEKKSMYRENPCPSVHFNLNDTLKAESLFVLVQGVKRIRLKTVNFSGRHKAQNFQSKTRSYAEIQYPFEHIAQKLLKERQDLPKLEK